MVEDVFADRDGDALLLMARPMGPACHEQTTSCFGDQTAPGVGFLAALENSISERAQAEPAESYTAALFAGGIRPAAQRSGRRV
jgi:phosphoribosyl-ATP pyrophosphohydrolase/phosphoribosyl-AMP cyclohydrolase